MSRLNRTTPQLGVSEWFVEKQLLAAIRRQPWFKQRVREIVDAAGDYSPPLGPSKSATDHEDRMPAMNRGRAGLPVLVTHPLTIALEKRRRRGGKPPSCVLRLRSTNVDGRDGVVRVIQYDDLVLN